jgi:hypothetical protein
MSDNFDQLLVGAGLDLLRADLGPPALVVCDGVVPKGVVPPYVLVYSTVDPTDVDPDNALNGRSNVWIVRWYCHSVGSGADASAARAVAQRVRNALLDKQVTVSGLACGLIRRESSSPPERDETTGQLYMDAISVYRLRATS